MDGVGSRVPVLVLSFHNCDLHCCHLDGYIDDAEGLLARLHEIESEFAAKPANVVYRVWYNLDENKLDASAMKAIVESIRRMRSHIYKIAFVGLHGMDRRKFDKLLKQTLKGKTMPRAYFTDAELAKEWLV